MREETLQTAREACITFQRRIADFDRAFPPGTKDRGTAFFTGRNETGAIKRASMELTNALRDLRKDG